MRSKQTYQLHTPLFCQRVRSQVDDKAKLPFLLKELTVLKLQSPLLIHTLQEKCMQKFPD